MVHWGSLKIESQKSGENQKRINTWLELSMAGVTSNLMMTDAAASISKSGLLLHELCLSLLSLGLDTIFNPF